MWVVQELYRRGSGDRTTALSFFSCLSSYFPPKPRRPDTSNILTIALRLTQLASLRFLFFTFADGLDLDGRRS
jgi:hypothetical protein